MKDRVTAIARSAVRDRRVVVVTAIVLVVVAGLFYARPWTAAQFDLRATGVWITNNSSDTLVHRIDTPVHTQDAELSVDPQS